MKPEIVLSGVAVVASTVTAVVSVVVSFRSQRAAAREQHMWDARAETYLGLQIWLDALDAWRDRAEEQPAPDLSPDTNARAGIYMSPTVLGALAHLRTELRSAQRALDEGDRSTFDRARARLSPGYTAQLTALMRHEMAGNPDPHPGAEVTRRLLPWPGRSATAEDRPTRLPVA